MRIVTLFQNAVILSVIATGITACNDNDRPKSERPALLSAAAEGGAKTPCTYINFINFARFMSDMQAYSSNFLKHYKVRHGNTLISIDDTRTKLSESLTIAQLDQLESYITPAGDEDKVGLKLYYAVDTTAGDVNKHRFYIVYKPVTLTKIESQATDSLKYDVIENVNTNYYILNGSGTLQPLNFFSDVLPKTNMYDSIVYHKNASGNYESVVIAPDPMSVLYPFEEIDSLVLHNEDGAKSFNSELEKNSSSFIDKYKIESIAGVTFYHIEDDRKNHNIYIAPNPVAAFGNFSKLFSSTNKEDIEAARIASGIFTGKVANLGSLCPPNCPKVSFPCN